MVGRDILNNTNIKVLSVVGPTASGKTALCIELAKRFNGEIISSDSMQIYKEFNIVTAKPSIEQLKKVKHHLIGVVPISKNFSVSDYVKIAKGCIKDINSRGKLPIITGGTGLYVDSLLNDVNFEETGYDTKIRSELFKKVENGEIEKLFLMLQKIDPESASKIHQNDIKRVTRAIEFYYSSGYPISQQNGGTINKQSKYNECIIGIGFKDRDVLYGRINKRVDQMFEDGLLDEVKKCSLMNIGNTASGAIGYKELLPFINGKCSLKEAIEKIKMETRRYAKRQLTWFRKNQKIRWIYADEYDDFEQLLHAAVNILGGNFS